MKTSSIVARGSSQFGGRASIKFFPHRKRVVGRQDTIKQFILQSPLRRLHGWVVPSVDQLVGIAFQMVQFAAFFSGVVAQQPTLFAKIRAPKKGIQHEFSNPHTLAPDVGNRPLRSAGPVSTR
jgi:hypothetical protein